jgi:hypothetical protein
VQTNVATPLPAGTSATWTVTTAGGTPPIESQFWRYNYTLGSWLVARPYSTSNSFTWTPGPADGGTHVFQVWVRSSGSTAEFEDWRATEPFTVTTAGPYVHSVKVMPVGPVQPGTVVTFDNVTSGGTGPIQFQYWKRNNSSSTWTILCSWSAETICAWTTTQVDRGDHLVQVWARNDGAVDVQAWRNVEDIVVSSVTSLAVSANVSFPAPASSPITWTATSITSSPVEYAFWLYHQETGLWVLARGYSASPLWNWTPSGSPGTYVVQVWARTAGGAASYEAWVSSGPFSLEP